MTATTEIQAFLYRVVTTNSAVATLVDDGSIRASTSDEEAPDDSALEFFGTNERRAAKRMGRVYELLHCFENSVRELIETTLRTVLEEHWWDEGVPETIRKKAETRKRDDDKARWHGPRGTSLLGFVDFPELAAIIVGRWDDFEDLLGDKDWVENYFTEMNRTRRAIGHAGDLSQHAVARMELFVREWLQVVG